MPARPEPIHLKAGASAMLIASITSSLGDVSSVVVVTADRDEAPGEVAAEASSVIEALKATGVGVKVLLVVEEDAIPEQGRDVVRVGRAVIESGVDLGAELPELLRGRLSLRDVVLERGELCFPRFHIFAERQLVVPGEHADARHRHR